MALTADQKTQLTEWLRDHEQSEFDDLDDMAAHAATEFPCPEDDSDAAGELIGAVGVFIEEWYQ